MLSNPRHANGFTLLEMIVVLVLIGLIMGLVGPRLFTQADKAKVQTAETQVRMIRGALETMRLDIGRYPSADEGLRLLVETPKDPKLATRWAGPYLDDALPLDPWKAPYQYATQPSANQPFSLYSFGADGQPAGEGFGTDVGFPPRK